MDNRIRVYRHVVRWRSVAWISLAAIAMVVITPFPATSHWVAFSTNADKNQTPAKKPTSQNTAANHNKANKETSSSASASPKPASDATAVIEVKENLSSQPSQSDNDLFSSSDLGKGDKTNPPSPVKPPDENKSPVSQKAGLRLYDISLLALSAANFIILGIVLFMLFSFSKAINRSFESARKNTEKLLEKNAQEIIAATLKPAHIQEELTLARASLLEEIERIIPRQFITLTDSPSENKAVASLSLQPEFPAKTKRRNSQKTQTASEQVGIFCEGRISSEALIQWAQTAGVRWGSASVVKGQTKLQISLEDPQNRILVFEDGEGTSEYLYVLKDAFPLSVDLKRFFEFEDPFGTGECQVRSVHPGRGKLVSEKELAILSPGTVKPSPS